MAIANKLKTIYDSCKDVRDVITGKDSSLGKGTITTLGEDITKICNPNNYIHKVIRDPIIETQIDPNTGEETEVVTGYTYKREDEYVGPNYTSIPYNKSNKNNTNLIDVILPDTVTRLSIECFCGCSSLRSINLEGIETLVYNGPNGDYCRAFEDCINLKINLNLPNLTDTIGADAFYSSGIIKINDLGKIQRIAMKAFADCPNLKYVVLPETLTRIENSAFAGCPIQIIICKAVTPPIWVNMASMYMLRELTNIYVPAESVSAYQSASNWSSYASKISAIPA